ncbi:MAG TPA: FmdB family zinc ribbon protein [Actinomycetota bacterium]|nr:FmdB family zinc ribbon protein [Actinomycetota bacterium]
MPTYEYVCQSCGTHVEVFQRFSEEPLTECGVCGGPLRKVFHPAGILFKGPGFYSTDSRSKAGATSKSGGDKAESPAGEASTPAAAKSGKSEKSKSEESSKAPSSSTKEKTA